jgi:hypothetical protein
LSNVSRFGFREHHRQSRIEGACWLGRRAGGAFSSAICIRDGETFRYRAGAGPGYSEKVQRFIESAPVLPGRGSRCLSREKWLYNDAQVRLDPEVSCHYRNIWQKTAVGTANSSSYSFCGGEHQVISIRVR